MGKIIFLPESVIQKTAAGEVIERPASVIKELIENSLDSGANSIKISVEDGGKKKILVTDNGFGMCKEDLAICHKPHTSSKLSTDKDLEAIQTFGFRGEALNSIGAVSYLSIKSKTEEAQTGWSLEVNYGSSSSLKPAGLQTGTIVEVQNLFSNLPARREFLKSSSVELNKITELVSSMIIANPSVAFSLESNERLIINAPLQYDLSKRIELFLDDSGKFLDLVEEAPHIRVFGKISLPQLSTNTGKGQMFFVNNRLIKWRKAVSRIKRAYGTLLDKYQYPKFALFLELPAELVDVNIHPRKEEVRLKNETVVLDFLERSIKKTLESANLTYRYETQKSSFSEAFYDSLTNSVDMWSVSEKPSSEDVKKVFQFLQTYLIVLLDDRVLLIDQHAAHEKVLYAQILDFLQGGRTEVLTLEEPILLESCSKEDLSSKVSHLSKYGIELIKREEHLEIKQIPELFKDLEIEEFVRYLLELEDSDLSLDYSSDISTTISTLACKNAIKAGDHLNEDQSVRLVKKLLNTKLEKYTCPHGRPTMVELNKEDFERMFKRI